MSDPVLEQPKRTNGLAVASLACAVFFIIPFTAILAIVFGIGGVVKARNPGIGGRGMAISGVVLGCVGLLIFPFIVRPSLSKVRETGNRILLYEKDGNHGGDGMFLLRADGRSEWHSLKDAHDIINASKKALAGATSRGAGSIEATVKDRGK